MRPSLMHPHPQPPTIRLPALLVCTLHASGPRGVRRAPRGGDSGEVGEGGGGAGQRAEEARVAVGAFPSLPTKHPNSSAAAAVALGGTAEQPRKVLSLDAKTKRVMLSLYSRRLDPRLALRW